MIFKSFIIVIFTLLSVSVSYGRVFDFGTESVAPYLNLRAGMMQTEQDPFRWQSVASYGGDDVEFAYGGEFGIYVRGGSFGVGLGILVNTYDPVMGAIGSNAAGDALYSVDSEGLSFGGQLSIDILLSQTPTHNWRFNFGGGYEFIKLENTYTMTTVGQPLVGGQSSFSESQKTVAPFLTASIGTEFHLSGTTTMNVTMGYHHSMAEEWNYGEGGTNFTGSYGQEGPVLFEDGSVKSISWSYPFLQIGFQFYIDTVR